jgi:hypothetical protein
MEAVSEYIVTRKLDGDAMEEIEANVFGRWPTLTSQEFNESVLLAVAKFEEMAKQYEQKALEAEHLLRTRTPPNDNQII